MVLTAILHAQTFWAIGKNHVGRTGNSARTMKQAITELRAGWYGDTNYWDWVYAGKPTTDGDGHQIASVAPAQFRHHARH